MLRFSFQIYINIQIQINATLQLLNIYRYRFVTKNCCACLIYFNIYTFSNIYPPLLFYLPTTLYINIILLPSLHLSLFCLFLFTLSYYKFVTIYSILCMVFSNKKRFSLSQFFDEFFIHSSIYAKLLIFGNPFFSFFLLFFFLHQNHYAHFLT